MTLGLSGRLTGQAGSQRLVAACNSAGQGKPGPINTWQSFKLADHMADHMAGASVHSRRAGGVLVAAVGGCVQLVGARCAYVQKVAASRAEAGVKHAGTLEVLAPW